MERAKPEEEHTPGQLSSEQALACHIKLQKAQKTSQEWSSRQFPLQGKWAPASSTEVHILTFHSQDTITDFSVLSVQGLIKK